MTMSISKVSWLHEAMIASSRRSVSWEQRAFFSFFARRLSRCSQLTERLEEATVDGKARCDNSRSGTFPFVSRRYAPSLKIMSPEQSREMV